LGEREKHLLADKNQSQGKYVKYFNLSSKVDMALYQGKKPTRFA